MRLLFEFYYKNEIGNQCRIKNVLGERHFTDLIKKTNVFYERLKETRRENKLIVDFTTFGPAKMSFGIRKEFYQSS